MYKQIILARKDLKMSPGKLAAQVSHGSMAFLTNLIKNKGYTDPLEKSQITGIKNDNEIVGYNFKYIFDKDLYEQWINGDFTKCVLQARNKNQLLKAKTMAEELGMMEGKDFFLIKDKCLTELNPEEYDENGIGRTLTCIGFRPMSSETIDKIAKKYHLYV